MRANTVYLALGLASISALISVSCGGESGSDDNSSGAGSSAMAGSSTAGGKSGSGNSGGTSQAGTDATGAAGDGSSAGTTSGGSGASGGTGSAGTPSFGGFGFAGSPDFGGAGAPFGISDCDAGVADGGTCTRAMGQVNACQLDATTYCTCSGGNNSTWQCRDLGGAGGAGGFGDVTCPASPMNGDDCTGTGICPGSSRCACAIGTVVCL